MAGLIWGGIGKGISDAGETFGRFMMADIQDRRQAAREEAYATRQEKSLEAAAERQNTRDNALLTRQQQAAADSQTKAEALERLKADLADQKVEDKRVRANKDLVDIKKRADEKESARDQAELSQSGPQLDEDAEQLAGLSKSIKGKGPGATPEKFKQLIKENPEYRKVYRDAGYISDVDPTKKKLARLEDESMSAIEIGADQNIINYYKDTRNLVLSQIKEQNKQQNQEDRIPIEQQRADAATTAANRPRGTGRTSSTRDPVLTPNARIKALQAGLKTERDKDKRAQMQAELDRELKLPGATNPAPAPAAERKVGATQVIQSGANKGKTAKWDGKGWVLAN